MSIVIQGLLEEGPCTQHTRGCTRACAFLPHAPFHDINAGLIARTGAHLIGAHANVCLVVHRCRLRVFRGSFFCQRLRFIASFLAHAFVETRKQIDIYSSLFSSSFSIPSKRMVIFFCIYM